MLVVLILSTTTKAFAQDNIPLVKVAISDSGFKSYVYNQISIVATADYAIYDKATCLPIMKLSPTDVAKVKFAAGKFEISLNNKVVAKNISATLVF